MRIDWDKFVLLLLPVKMRVKAFFGLIRAMIAGLEHVYNMFLSYEREVKYKLIHSSQVWSLEAVLNDEFDTELRRIKIEDAEMTTLILLYPDDDEENRPAVLLQDDNTGAWLIHPDHIYQIGEYDFTAVMPGAYSEDALKRVRSLIDYYKLAGKRYNIIDN
jgi:hypothetical protein